MSHQLSLGLSDEEYALLAAEAAKSGMTIEAVARAAFSTVIQSTSAI